MHVRSIQTKLIEYKLLRPFTWWNSTCWYCSL